MTRLEELVWATAYVDALHCVAGTRVDKHRLAVQEADSTVLAMRRAIGYDNGRLHANPDLENKRGEKHVLEMNGHHWEFVGDGEPHDVEHCVYCNESYASGSFPGSARQCPGKRDEHQMRPVVVQEVSMKLPDGRPASRIEMTFPEGQNTVTIKEAKHVAREVLEEAEEARKPVELPQVCAACQLYDGLSVAGLPLCLHPLGYDACQGRGCHLFWTAKEQADTFEQKVARVEQAVAELKAYQATVGEKLAEVMAFAEELRKEHEGKK